MKDINEYEKNYNGITKKINFVIFANKWFETVKKPNLTKMSYDNYYHKYQNYIIPALKKYSLNEIRPIILQNLLNDIIKDGKERTAEDIKLLLNGIMQYACDNNIINYNPIRAVRIQKHYRTNGKAISIEEEKHIINIIKGNTYEMNIILIIYCGLRPCEVNTVNFDKIGFITSINAKRKTRKTEYKYIPISPMLQPYIVRLKTELKQASTITLDRAINKLNLNITLTDLRHTFASRCQMLGVRQEIVAEWLGHSRKALMTDKVYTHYSDEFMLNEVKKICY